MKKCNKKTCKKCGDEKELNTNNFYARKDSRDGFRNSCKECDNSRIKNYQTKNYDKIKSYSKTYREENSDKIKTYHTNLIKNNPQYYKAMNKSWYLRNKDKKILYVKERRKTDILYRLKLDMRSSIGNVLRKKGYTKKSKTNEILGCSYEEFMRYIESKFEPWMNWENYGLYKSGKYNYGWDIDHIIPLSSAKAEEEMIKLNHYSNLQPLCSYTNRVIKRDKF